MKFSLSFKTPDVTDQIEMDDMDDATRSKVKSVLEKFLQYDEYCTVEFDSDTQTATMKEM